MDAVTIDMDKLLADVATADAEVKAAEELVATAGQRLDNARARRASVENVLNVVRKYAVDVDERIAAGSVPAGPLKGLSATVALAEFVKMNPGITVKVGDAYNAMVTLGFDGSINSVQVAFASAWKDAKIVRLRKGIYTFPAGEESKVLSFPAPTIAGPAEAHPDASAGGG